MGILIAIEGLDGSGKGTQTKRICERLKAKQLPFKTVSFPNYDSPAASLVKMYLNGDFGTHPQDVNAYAASSFYAVDRYASYRTDWEKNYRSGDIIVCNRYTTSNLFHQMVKLPKEEWNAFSEWLSDFEYERLGLPKPDAVLYFDMDPDISQKLLAGRYHGDEQKKDIHERDLSYLRACRETALYAAEKFGWNVIRCFAENKPLSVEDIETAAVRVLENKLKISL